MQKLSGRGTAFIEIDGDLAEYELAPGQQMIVDTGNVAGFDSTVSIDIQKVSGVKCSSEVRACLTRYLQDQAKYGSRPCRL